jgi:uncharacterized membrane protein YfcA
MSDFLPSLIPPYFHLWHIPLVFFAGLIGEGYGAVIGSGGILIQFVLAAIGMPLPIVVATDLAGGLGSNAGALVASPRSIWKNRKLLLILGTPFFIGGVIGTIFLTRISQPLLRWLLILALVSLLVYMLFKKKTGLQKLKSLHVRFRQYPLLNGIMLGLGVYGNVSGIGVGTFQKITFTGILKLGVVDSIGISNIIDLAPTIFSLVVTAIVGLIAWPYMITLLVSTYIGANYTVKFVGKIRDKYLQILLFIVALAYLFYLLWFATK